MCSTSVIPSAPLQVAEMYPAPASDPKWMPGVSEEIIGRWFAKDPARRHKVILATKVPNRLHCTCTHPCTCWQDLHTRVHTFRLALTWKIMGQVMGYSPNSDTAGNRKITLGTGGEVADNGR